MSTKQETNIAAVIEEKGARFKIINRNIPKPGPHEFEFGRREDPRLRLCH